jgi:hypothetical protein
MRRFRLKRPSSAMVVAMLALMVALGGTGYAASQLPKNSVGTKQIKKNAVNSAKVKNRSLLAKDFKRGQLPAGLDGLDGDTGPVGPTGPQGAAGTNGTNGAAGATNVRIREAATASTAPDTMNNTSTASCDTGEVAVGGGVKFELGTVANMQLSDSYPNDSNADNKPDQWIVNVTGNGGSVDFKARVVCASP